MRVARSVGGELRWVDVTSAGPYAFIVLGNTVTNKELTNLEEKRLLEILNNNGTVNRWIAYIL